MLFDLEFSSMLGNLKPKAWYVLYSLFGFFSQVKTVFLSIWQFDKLHTWLNLRWICQKQIVLVKVISVPCSIWYLGELPGESPTFHSEAESIKLLGFFLFVCFVFLKENLTLSWF